MKRILMKSLLVAGAVPWFLAAQTYTMQTAVGNVDDRSGRLAAGIALFAPEAVALDSAGNVYIADTGAHRENATIPQEIGAVALITNH